MSPTIKLLRRKKPEKTVNSRALAKFYATTRWRKLRLYKLSQDPLCQNCIKEGRITPAKEVHHTKALNPYDIDLSIALDYDLLQSLCVNCHRLLQSK